MVGLFQKAPQLKHVDTVIADADVAMILILFESTRQKTILSGVEQSRAMKEQPPL